MIKFSEEARASLREFLSTALYARAKQSVTDGIEIQVIGSLRSAEQVALDLAVKEGVLMAFRNFENLALPQTGSGDPILPKQIERTNKRTEL